MRFLVLLSAAGGGDRQPVVAAASALVDAGHDVTAVFDEASHSLFGSDRRIEWIPNDVPQVGYIGPWAKLRLAGEPTRNPLMSWADAAAPTVIDDARDAHPDLIVSSLFCMGLANALSQSFNAPWCFINPSFYFGDQSARLWTEDWYGPFVPILAEECFSPLADAADLVLHATPQPEPRFLTHSRSSDWVLVTASTSRPEDETMMLTATLEALSDQPVQVALTLPQDNWDEPVPDNTIITGFVPHRPILDRSILCVSQAGHGIVSKCLTQGVPMVLLPWDADQPGVADRAHSLGVAAVVPRDEATPDAIAQSVTDVLTQPSYTSNARNVAAKHASRDPLQAVVEQLITAAARHA